MPKQLLWEAKDDGRVFILVGEEREIDVQLRCRGVPCDCRGCCQLLPAAVQPIPQKVPSEVRVLHHGLAAVAVYVCVLCGDGPDLDAEDVRRVVCPVLQGVAVAALGGVVVLDTTASDVPAEEAEPEVVLYRAGGGRAACQLGGEGRAFVCRCDLFGVLADVVCTA